MSKLKVALAHDYLWQYGGAERVLEALHEIFPQAPIYTAYLNLQNLGSAGKEIKKWKIITSWYQKFPLNKQLLSPMRMFAPLMFESFDLSQYDVVISSSSAAYFAKAVLTKPQTLHLSYIHTPPRFLWGYTSAFNFKKNPLVKLFAELSNHFLRIWDYAISQRPDILVANSKNIQERIKKFYRRNSVVIYPPVDLSEFKNAFVSHPERSREGSQDYYLALGRLVRGKGVEVIVEACTKLNLPLKVAGDGSELKNLKKIAGKSVEFLGFVSDGERVKLYKQAKALIVASEDEDFGITPVEAMASGTPVIAPRSGGFLETVIDNKTGLLYGSPGLVKVDDLVAALKRFQSMSFKADDCFKQAGKFSKENFKKEILKLVNSNFRG